MIRYIVLIIIWGALFGQGTFAQTKRSNKRPDWTKEGLRDIKNTNSSLQTIVGEGCDQESAWENARQKLTERLSWGHGKEVSVSFENGVDMQKSKHNMIVKARVLDEYIERIAGGSYRGYWLIQSANHIMSDFVPLQVTEEYPFSPRIFVPGMAQLHKGSTTKGVLFIVGEIAAIGGAFVFENRRHSYESKINNTRYAVEVQDYIKMSDNMRDLRNGCIAGAAFIYALNLIDGIIAKGKKHIVTRIPRARVTPYTTVTTAGVKLSLNF